MKSWQFWLLVALIGAVLIIVIKIGTGLQAAQAQVTKITTPFSSILGKLGLT